MKGYVRCILAALMLFFAQGVTVCHAQGTSQPYAFVFKDADISQVADELLGNTLGVSYRVEPGVSGKMNFRIEQKLTKAQLLAAFEAALANYDVAMVQDGDTLVLKPRDKAQIGGQVSTASSPASTVGYQIRAIAINYGSAEEIAKALTTVTHADMVLFSSDKLGLILIGGRSEELDNAASTIALFDQSTLGQSRIRFFPLQNASAATVAIDLENVLKASGTSSVTIAPMPRLNGIFAFSKSPEALDEVTQWMARLDVPSNDPTVKVWVYHPKGASAENLVRTLNAVLGLADTTGSAEPAASPSSAGSVADTGNLAPASAPAPAPPAAGGSDTVTRIVADKDTNSIIVNAPEATRIRVMNVLDEIDREPAQIFIEASILEVNLTNDFTFGVDWKKVGDNNKLSVSSYSGSATNFPAAAPGFSVNYVGTDITAAIRALSSESHVSIVSAPKITTVENSTARLQIGDEVPIVTQSAQSTVTTDAALVNTIEYRDTGVMLEVTPHIASDDRISLDVTQEVSSVAKTQTSGIDSPTIKQRHMESKLIIPEGTVVALGGLISTSQDDSNGGVPVIKDIPVLGNLFKGRTKSSDRTELVVLLQATILRDPAAYTAVLDNLGADLKDLIHVGDWSATPQ